MSTTQNLTLLTDFYELTMMQGYFKNPVQETVIFDAFYRTNPCGNGFAIAAGLDQVIDYIKNLHFSEEDINDRVRKIDKILNEINIKDIEPYTIIELLEQYDNREINKDLSAKIENLIHAAGYEKTAVDFVKFINEDLYKEEPEESEENEIL